MIPGPFSYHRPATLADAVKLLQTLGDDARPLAGGHSLVPMMKLRLASPEHRANLLRPSFRRVGIGALQGTFLGHRGARVVTAGIHSLEPGQQVRIEEDKKP